MTNLVILARIPAHPPPLVRHNLPIWFSTATIIIVILSNCQFQAMSSNVIDHNLYIFYTLSFPSSDTPNSRRIGIDLWFITSCPWNLSWCLPVTVFLVVPHLLRWISSLWSSRFWENSWWYPPSGQILWLGFFQAFSNLNSLTIVGSPSMHWRPSPITSCQIFVRVVQHDDLRANCFNPMMVKW